MLKKYHTMDLTSGRKQRNFKTRVQKRIKHIQDQATRTIPKYVPLFEKKQFRKPEVQLLYMDSNKMGNYLTNISKRIGIGKYKMIISAKKNPQQKLAAKKKIIQDTNQTKQYQQIYEEFKEDNNSGEVLRLNNIVTRMYQLYDEDDAEFRSRFSFSNLKHHNSFCLNEENQQNLNQFISQKQEPLYQSLFEEVAAKNSIYQNYPPPNPNELIKNKLKDKMIWNKNQRIKNFQKDKLNHKGNRQINQKHSPYFCRLMNQQRRLLRTAEKQGLSEENISKLEQQFYLTKIDLKSKTIINK